MTIALPAARLNGTMSVERALAIRRSVRDFSATSLTLSQISQLLWAAQGITNENGFRTAPSAGATYPLEVYLVAGKVEELAPGIYRYNPREHALELVMSGDIRAALSSACFGQEWVDSAPISVVISAVFERTTRRYGKRGIQYVHMEVGHAAQNIYLQATALNLGTVIVGAFDDNLVMKVMRLPHDEIPLAVLPVGHPTGKPLF